MRARAINFLSLTSAVLLLCFFAGCGGLKKQLVGQWKTQMESSESTWQFFGNGALKQDGAPGRYTLGANEQIKIETQLATFVYRCEIKGDAMTWTAASGAKTEFTRVK
jgi:hypothetical protein